MLESIVLTVGNGCPFLDYPGGGQRRLHNSSHIINPGEREEGKSFYNVKEEEKMGGGGGS